jgi:hypothetical protein
MPKFPLPSENTNVIKLADWLELLATQAADHSSSSGDLQSALTTAAVVRREKLEAKILSVFAELESRSRACGDAYPFLIDGAVLEAKADLSQSSSYLFCLALSYFGWSKKRSWEINVDPWLLFEELSAIAAAEFIGGKVRRFGTSRLPASKKGVFKSAVDQLCVDLDEGVKFRPQPIRWKKDDKVDLVAWRDFADKKRSKLIMFGQCSGGDNFKDKLSDLDPDAFWRKWMSESNVSPHLKSFYIPHRIPREDWDNQGRDCGIIFDRCRVSHWAFRRNAAVLGDARYRRWCRHILRYPKPRDKP